MKNILFCWVILLTVSTVATAQEKVIDRSGKQLKWAKNLVEANYIITSGNGATIAEAQQVAVLMVKQEIVRGVAEQVVSTSTVSMQETNSNVMQTYSQNITSKASKAPFVQGISTNQIEEFYWEKIGRGKSKSDVFYRYYVKYPFSQAQMSKLVNEFRAEDFKIAQRIDELEADLSHIASVEQIDAAVGELATLADAAEGGRKDNVAALLSRYRALYNNIYITTISHTAGSIEYRLSYGNGAMQSVRQPRVKSECADIRQVSVGDTCRIHYASDGCYRDAENFIEVSYQLGGKKVLQNFLIP